MLKLARKMVAGGYVTLVREGECWGVMVELEGVEWKINWHTDEDGAKNEYRAYIVD